MACSSCCPAIAYPLSALDPLCDDPSRDDGEELLALVRALLRSCENVDAAIAAILEGVDDADAADVKVALESALLAESPAADRVASLVEGAASARFVAVVACRLVAPSVALVTSREADTTFNTLERTSLIPIAEDGDRCAILHGTPAAAAAVTAAAISPPPRIVLDIRVASALAHVELAPAAADDDTAFSNEKILVSVLALDGKTKRRLSLQSTSPTAVRAAFDADALRNTRARAQQTRMSRMLLPRTCNQLPAYLVAEIANFLQTRLRLHVLTAAAMPASEPENKSNRFLAFEEMKASYTGRDAASKRFAIKATLHPSSATCICKLHNLNPINRGLPNKAFTNSGVVITLSMCGRATERTTSGSDVCPVHRGEGCVLPSLCPTTCCSNAEMRIECVHETEDGARFKGACIGPIKFLNADRLEAQTLLVAAMRSVEAVRAIKGVNGGEREDEVFDDDDGVHASQMIKLADACNLNENWLTQRLEAVQHARARARDVISDDRVTSLDIRATQLLRQRKTYRMRRGQGEALFSDTGGGGADRYKVLVKPDSDLHSTPHFHIFPWAKRPRTR